MFNLLLKKNFDSEHMLMNTTSNWFINSRNQMIRYSSPFRGMLWKIQSGIVPPLFYVIIAEKDKLKALKQFIMCPRNTVDQDCLQNAVVDPNVQSQQMYPVWLNTEDLMPM